MKYIAICGTVGAGKTTLLQRLTAYFGPRAAVSMRSAAGTTPISMNTVPIPNAGRFTRR